MSSNEFDHNGDTKKFTVTAFLSFAIVFAFIMLMERCHGTFKVADKAEETHAAAEK